MGGAPSNHCSPLAPAAGTRLRGAQRRCCLRWHPQSGRTGSAGPPLGLGTEIGVSAHLRLGGGDLDKPPSTSQGAPRGPHPLQETIPRRAVSPSPAGATLRVSAPGPWLVSHPAGRGHGCHRHRCQGYQRVAWPQRGQAGTHPMMTSSQHRQQLQGAGATRDPDSWEARVTSGPAQGVLGVMVGGSAPHHHLPCPLGGPAARGHPCATTLPRSPHPP